MMTIKKYKSKKYKSKKYNKSKKTKILNRKFKKSIKNKTKANKINKINKINKQYGSALMNAVFSIKKEKSYSIPGTAMFNKAKNLFAQPPKKQFLSIHYNYRTSYEIIIKNHTIFESAKLLFLPHIVLDHNMHTLFVMICPATKPILIWATNIKNRVQTSSIIPYKLPVHQIHKVYKVLYRLYKYPHNIEKTFSFKDHTGYNQKDTISPTLAYEKLQAYLKLNKMEHAVPHASGEFNIRQNPGANKTNIFNILTQKK